MTKKRKIILVVVLLAVILSVLLAKPVIHMVIELFEPGQESLNDLFQLKKGEVALVVDDTVIYGNCTDHGRTLAAQLLAEGLRVAVT